jgi:excisionase family DNA binding protein
MSSKIEVQRVCQNCEQEFTARTTVTKYCSHKCSQRAYKARIRSEKVQKSNTETKEIIHQPIEKLKAKEFLTVREVARLLNCSVRSVYYYIGSGTIKAVNLGQRITRVKRSEIDKLFEQTEIEVEQNISVVDKLIQELTGWKQAGAFEISDCYTINEVLEKYSISETALQNLIKRESIPKIKKGWYAYVPKPIIDKLLS